MFMNVVLKESGLTQTSANHLANVAKEMYEKLDAQLAAIRLQNRDYTLAAGGQVFRIENESAKEELLSVEPALKQIAQLKSFIAYLREGIKAKESLMSDLSRNKHLDKLVKEGHRELLAPDYPNRVSLEDVVASLSVEDQAHYFALEARSATYGQYIHPDGVIAKARKEFFKRKKNPAQVSGSGADAEINTYSTTFSAEEVDSTFFALQKMYRRSQAEFNKLKASLEEQAGSRTRKKLESYQLECKEVKAKRDAAILEYENGIKKLKIAIPESLKEVYEMVNHATSE